MAHSVANRVRIVRRAAEVTQAEWAERIALGSAPAVTRLELGQLTTISFETLAAILAEGWRSCQMSPSEMLWGTRAVAYVSDEELMEELRRRVGDKLLASLGMGGHADGNHAGGPAASPPGGALDALIQTILDRAKRTGDKT